MRWEEGADNCCRLLLGEHRGLLFELVCYNLVGEPERVISLIEVLEESPPGSPLASGDLPLEDSTGVKERSSERWVGHRPCAGARVEATSRYAGGPSRRHLFAPPVAWPARASPATRERRTRLSAGPLHEGVNAFREIVREEWELPTEEIMGALGVEPTEGIQGRGADVIVGC